MVTLPQLTREQRREAADKAVRARAARAQLKDNLRAGGTTLAEVLERAETDEAVARLRVLDLLRVLPGVGEVTAAAIMERLGIARSRRLGGLGSRQRAGLAEEFASRG